jgi:hypothetical protein
LKKDAVPSKFPNLPEYYSCDQTAARSEGTSSSSRREKQAAAVEEASSKFLQLDQVTTLQELSKKLDQECLPSDFVETSRPGKLLFLYLPQDETKEPQVQASLTVLETLQCQAWCGGVQIPQARIAHIVKGGKLFRASDVANVLAFLKSYSQQPQCADAIQHALTILEQALPIMEEEEQKRMSFLIEQLGLCTRHVNNRRYSPYLTACAITWQSTSPALYHQLLQENVLVLPTVRYLKKLSGALTVETGLAESSVSYLTARFKTLLPREHLVTVMIDEVYCDKRIEFVGGKIYGLQDEEATRTLLCYMVQSVAGKYRDMIAMVPIKKIDSSVLLSNFQKVVQCLSDIGFDVVTVSTDGHSSNRKFYSKELCQGKIVPSIPHPVREDHHIFMVFDPVHLFKNFFTNFLNRKVFSCPAFEDIEVSAKFDHIIQLYNHELGRPIKIAHKLTQKVLTPRPIERCNVMLAERCFHESTIAGLIYYGERGFPEWKKTAAFLDLIHKWWSIVNVRTMTIGLQKRDENKKPVTEVNGAHVEFFHKFAAWLVKWQKEGDRKTSLSSETFFCAQQTCTALPPLIEYLLTKKGLNFILLGKISSDPIERRFGQYRQLAGANYFLSVRQFLEAEKLIRLKALVKFTRLNMSEIKDLFEDSEDNQKADIFRNRDEVLELLSDKNINIEQVEDSESAIVYYVAGYIARSILRRLKCQLCADLICESKEAPEIMFAEDESSVEAKQLFASFLEQVNRGGLVKPSDLMFLFCLHAHEFLKMVLASASTKKTFLSVVSHRAVFAAALLKKMDTDQCTKSMIENRCSLGHELSDVFSKVANSFCNCMLKNFVSEINDTLHESRKRGSGSAKTSQEEKKIAKLQSK